MPALTPSILTTLETRMRIITEREYDRLNSNLWWQRITTSRTTDGLKDTVIWLLSTAQIRDQGKGGNIAFDDIVAQYSEVENKFAGTALKLQRRELEDHDGGGVQLAAQWSADVGAYSAYWPQKGAAHFLMNAHTPGVYNAYDKKPYFAVDHPNNPYNLNAGVFANVLTGVAAAPPAPPNPPAPAYPGKCPIDDSVTLDVALQNLAKVVAYIGSLRMPNGIDPRFLRPATLIVPPRMFPRAVQLTQAKFIAQAATGGAAVGDVEALIKSLGFAMPIQADELAGFENDTTYFVATEQLSTSQLGALIYTNREPFKINYYGTMDDAVLSRSQELEWHCIGRNVMSGGHPYLLFKCMGT